MSKKKKKSVCKKCTSAYGKKCHHCGRDITIFNHIDNQFTLRKNGPIHYTGRCCSD